MKSDKRSWKTILTATVVLSLAVLVESATAEETAEYGDVEWGMSMKEVRNLVPGGTTEKNIVKGSTFYKASRQFGGTEFEATYRFDDGKLTLIPLNAAGEKSYPVMIRYRKPQPED